MKKCTACLIEKEDYCFEKYRNKCRECRAIDSLKHYELNKESRKESHRNWTLNNKEYVSLFNKEYYDSHKDDILLSKKEYTKEHPCHRSEYQKEYNKTHREENNLTHNKYAKLRSQNDPAFKIRKNVSSSIFRHLKSLGGSKKNKSCIDYFGYCVDVLKEHLEKQFEPWMTWGNHGKYSFELWSDNDPSTWTWQIDHIIPHSTFNYTSMEDQAFKDCWALSNLRPLSSKQNYLDGINKTRHKLII